MAQIENNDCSSGEPSTHIWLSLVLRRSEALFCSPRALLAHGIHTHVHIGQTLIHHRINLKAVADHCLSHQA